MLSSAAWRGGAGPLSALPCPFFADGLCDRPLCHFSHNAPDAAEPESAPALPAAPSTAGLDNLLQLLPSAKPPVPAPVYQAAPLPADPFAGYVASVEQTDGFGYAAPSYGPESSYAPTIVQEAAALDEGGYVGYFASLATPDQDHYRPDRPLSPPAGLSPQKRGGLLGDRPDLRAGTGPSQSQRSRPSSRKARPGPNAYVPTPIPKPRADFSPEPEAKEPPKAEPPKPKSSIRDIKSMIRSSAKPRVVKPVKPLRKVKAPPPPKPAESINDLAKSVTQIDRQIAELKRKMESDNGNEPLVATGLAEADSTEPDSTTSPAKPKKRKKEAGSSDSGLHPGPSRSSEPPAYQPTPLSELERKAQRKEERRMARAKAAEDTAAAAAAAAKEKKAKNPAKQVLVDLFGSDEDEEEPDSTSPTRTVLPPPPPKEAKKRKKKEPSPPPEATKKEQLDIVPIGRKAHAGGHGFSAEALQAKALSVGRRTVAGPSGAGGMRFVSTSKAKEDMMRRVVPPSEAKPKASPHQGAFQSHREGALAASVPKGELRKAHAPRPPRESDKRKKPTVALGSVSHVPPALRNRYLSLFVDEVAKFAASQEEAHEIALREEEAVNGKVKSKGGYLSAAVQSIKRLREAGGSTLRPSGSASAVSHQANLDRHQNYTLARSGVASMGALDLSRGSYFHSALQKYLLNEEQLDANGFPRPPLEGMRSDEASFHRLDGTNPSGKPKTVADDDLDRTCCRCGTPFRLTEEGRYEMVEDCVYHWGRSWNGRKNGQWDRRFSCCQAEAGAPGCSVAVRHVSDAIREKDAGGYVRTAPLSATAPLDDPRRTAVYGLDCEMVHTVWGTGLARVTVVDAAGSTLLDEIVRPKAQIVDCNSRFSGLTPAHFEGVTTSLQDVQERLLELISAETILLGHSLEGDLRALRIVHDAVVDTSLVYPHRKGPPFKRALRTLAAEVLQKIIQDDVGGHDSAEDALTCVLLMQHRVREDAKAGKRAAAKEPPAASS